MAAFALDYIRLQWSTLVSVGEYYHSFSAPELRGKFIFAPASLLGGCVLPLEFAYFAARGKIPALDLYFSTCAVTFLTIGDSFNGLLGSRFGTTKFPGSKTKTMLGTASCFGFSLATSLGFLLCLAPKVTAGLV